MKKINLSGYFPILGFENEVVFASNGNVLLGFSVELPEIYSQSERDFEDLHNLWFQAFKSLPVQTVIHKQDVYQKAAYTAENLPKDTFLEKATHDYFKGRAHIEHRSYLFFLLPFNKTLQTSKYANPFIQIEKAIAKKLDQGVADFLIAVQDAVSYLNNSKQVTLTKLLEEDMLDLTFSYFNGFNEGFDTDILLHKSNIAIGDHFFDVLAINSENCFGENVQSSKTNPKFTSDDFVFHQGFIDGLGLHLNENHMVNQILYLDDRTSGENFWTRNWKSSKELQFWHTE